MKARLAKKRGFSLIEMLIVLTVFSLITSVIAVLFTQGMFTYRHGESHLMMQRGGRILAGRVTPYLASMFDAVTPSLTPLWLDTDASAANIVLGQRMPVNPARGNPGTLPVDPEASKLYFTTTEDWLGVGYPSQFTSSTKATSTQDLRSYPYRVRYEDPNPAVFGDGQILLERLIPGGAGLVVDQSRPLYIEKDESLKDFRFVLTRANLLQMEFTMQSRVRSAQNLDQVTNETFRFTFNLPTKSL